MTGTLGQKLFRLRTERGLSQAAAASKAGLSRLAYLNIENDKSSPKVDTVQAIAVALQVPVSELFTRASPLTDVRFRSSKKLRSRDAILVEVERQLERYNFVLRRLGTGKQYMLKDCPFDPDPRESAKIARNELLKEHSGEPIRNIWGLLEQEAGIKVFALPVVTDGFFGLSVGPRSGGPAIFVNTWERISVERWIFSAAHELGHLVLHFRDSFDVQRDSEDQTEEDQANVFASYFLMPEEKFKAEWEASAGLKFTDRVHKVKRIFRVSYATVLYRLQDKLGPDVWRRYHGEFKLRFHRSLPRTEEPNGISHDKFCAPPPLRADEPEYLSPVDFQNDRLLKLVLQAVKGNRMPASEAAVFLGVQPHEIENLLEESTWLSE